MTMSVRLDTATRARLARLASENGKTLSALIRDAIRQFVQESLGAENRNRPYDYWAPVVGCARGGPRNLSVRTGAGFLRLLKERRARR